MAAPWADPRFVLTGVIVLVAVVHGALGHRWVQQGPTAPISIGLLLLAVVWIPERWRDLIVVIGAGGLGLMLGETFAGRLLAAGILGGLMALCAWGLRGGVAVGVLGVVVFVGVFAIPSAIKRLRRLSRAAALQPGTEPRGEVELGGIASARQATPLPSDEEHQVAAWWISAGLNQRSSPRPLEIACEAGMVQVELAGLEADLTSTKELAGEAAAAVIEALGIELEEVEGDEDGPRIDISWIDPGTEVHVIGRPRWAAAHGAGGYRDSSLVAVFGGQGTYLADRAEAELAREARGNLLAWATWGPVSLAVAVYAAMASG